MYQIWLKIFFRNSKKNWLNTLINISGLTLGLAGLLIVLLYINEEKNYNQWNPNKDDVYRVNLKQAKNAEVWFTVNAGMYLTFPRELPEVTASLMVKPFYRSKVIKYKDEFEFNEKTIFTEPQFFDFFPFKILEGSTQKFAETRNNIALSKAYANRVFKDDKAVGNTVKIDGESYVVSCVYEIPKNSHQEPDLLIQFDEAFEENWGNHNNEVFCRITEGSDLEGLKKKMNQVIIEKAYRKNVEENGMTIAEFDKAYGIPTVLLDKLDTLYLHNTAKRAGPSGTGNYQLLMVLLGLSILLIVISCVNFINLSVATGTQRAKEVGVKKTLGLSKKQLLFQYISEIILQGFVSFVFALLIVELALPFFNDFVETEISILHTSSLATLFLAAIFVSFLVGSIPAIIALSLATFVEILAYYIPWVDNLLDSISIPLAGIAGTLLMAATLTDLSPMLTWGLAIVAGGGAASSIKTSGAATRAASSVTTAGVGNPIISSAETGTSLVLSIVSIFLPFLGFLWISIKSDN